MGYQGLTHWGRVTHICVSKLTIIGSDNGLSPGRCQAIIWTNAGILLIGPLGTKFNEISIKIHTFHSRKCIWKCCLWNGGHFVSASMCYLICLKFYLCPCNVSCAIIWCKTETWKNKSLLYSYMKGCYTSRFAEITIIDRLFNFRICRDAGVLMESCLHHIQGLELIHKKWLFVPVFEM